MSQRSTRFHCRDLSIAAGVYLFFFLLWLGLKVFTGDTFTVIALLNFIALYLFAPLILILLVAVVCRNRWLGIGFMVGVAAFLWFWGDLFINWGNPEPEQKPILKVMTYNVLAWHNLYEPILETIRTEDPDVLLLQELNSGLAETLESQLISEYPYQVLRPVDNPEGIGVISKYPLEASGISFPQLWAGGPQILNLSWNGEPVLLVNFHLTPTTGVLPLDEAETRIRAREEEVRILADLAQGAGATIMGGDANMTSMSDAYKVITGELVDAFRSSGFGFGHTFPGSTLPESDRPRIGSLFAPAWVVRIDYIFHSGEWTAISARTAKVDGVSDHRGVIVELIRKD